MKDLTKGKPSTLILAFALPIFFANLLQLTYSLPDHILFLYYLYFLLHTRITSFLKATS